MVVPDPCIFFPISKAGAVIPNRTKTFLANGTATFINRPATLPNNEPKNLHDCIILNI